MIVKKWNELNFEELADPKVLYDNFEGVVQSDTLRKKKWRILAKEKCHKNQDSAENR